MSRIYVCLSILPMQGEEIGPSIHTYMEPCRLFFGRFEMYVAFSSPCVVEMGYVCRFDQFLRENEHTYIHTLHTYIHPHKQTYNSSSRFSHHLEKRIPCMFANAGHRIIQPTWKIDRFFENPEFQIPRPGPRFWTETSTKT